MAVIPGSPAKCSVLSSDYYACHQQSSVVVWKFAAELGISWNLDDPPFKVRRPQCLWHLDDKPVCISDLYHQ